MDDVETYGNEPSKTEDTLALYKRIFQRLKTFTKDDLARLGEPFSEDVLTPFAVVHTFREREASWSKSTAKLYRVALAYCLTNIDSRDAYEASCWLRKVDADECIDDERRIKREREHQAHAERVKRTRKERLAAMAAGDERPRTSGQKAKRLSASDLSRLMDVLQRSCSKWGAITAIWIYAGYLTGLRPSEWATAKVGVDEKGRPVLIVSNGKATNGRAFGEHRHIALDKLSDRERSCIEAQVRTANEYETHHDFGVLYDGCRMLLHAITRRLWPNRTHHPTLYTARHMFASNAKQVFSKIEVAALMGHASQRTAALHYGKRRYANGGLNVHPSEADVIAVAAINRKLALDSKDKRNANGTGGYQ